MMSKLDELGQLASLRERGVLSESEFATAKAEILGGASWGNPDAISATEHPVDAETIGEAHSDAGFPLWAIQRPIETTGQANSLLYAGYYSATGICVQGVIFLSRFPVGSDVDNIALVIVLAIFIAFAVLTARSVAKKASVGAAWLLLMIAGCQAFGTATGGRWDWGMIALGTASVIVSIQAVRATSALQRLSSPTA